MSPAQGPGRDDLTDDPEVPEEDALEQRAEADGDPGADEASGPDELEEPDEDALEAVERGEADAADVAEQARAVGADEDDYR
jgi:hypothetical protein